MKTRAITALTILLCSGVAAVANEPVASYIFPAGAQRGTKCEVRVGGLFLYDGCGFDVPSPGVRATAPLKRVPNIWFEGPVVPLPDSQLAEDYPQDYATSLEIAADAPLGTSYWRLSTAEGATATRRFVVGDLPEIVETEIDGEPLPVAVTLPVTINGRIFPREDVDVWSFTARTGQIIWAEVCAQRVGSPLDARLEITDTHGKRLAEALGNPSREASLSFTAPADGTYHVRIHDINFGGLQTYVYRLTLSSGPHVATVFPLGGRRGETTRFELSGAGVPSEPVAVALPNAATASLGHRFEVGGQLTNSVELELDDLPEVLEHEANDDAGHAEAVALPAIVNGRIGKPGDADYFAIAVSKGQTYEFDLRAGRLGSPLDPVLIVSDADGKEVVRNDDLAAGNTDSQCLATAAADGRWTVRIEDRLPSRGSAAFAYRLRMEPARSDFRLVFASDALNLVRGKEARLRIDIEGAAPLDSPIDLQWEGLPAGVTASPAQIPAKAKQVEIVFKTPDKTSVTTGRLTVRGTARIGEQSVTHTAQVATLRGEPAIEHVYWAVALEPPFKIVGTYQLSFTPRGGFVERRYKLARTNFNGPVEVRLADRQMRHLQGITGPTIAVPAGAEEFDYQVFLPPWMELGRTSRSVPMAVGVLKDFDGSEHVLSYSSIEQNQQIVLRVSSGLLSVATDRESILAKKGGTASVQATVTREASQQVPVRLELIVPPHVTGVKAEPVVLGPAEASGPLKVEFSPECGVFNMPLIVRATSLSADRPAVAETRLEIVAAR